MVGEVAASSRAVRLVAASYPRRDAGDVKVDLDVAAVEAQVVVASVFSYHATSGQASRVRNILSHDDVNSPGASAVWLPSLLVGDRSFAVV